MLLIAKNWWSLVVRGVVAILLGIVSFIWPGITLGALVLVFGAYAFIDGVVNIAAAIRHSRLHQRWAALLFEGIAGVLAGFAAFAWPAITLAFLIALIGIWAVVTGVLEIIAALRLRNHIRGEWLLGLIGIASVLFGVMLFVAPLAGALVLATWFGVYALITGVMFLALGFRLKRWMGSGGGNAVAATAS